jgi:hypothetical protein
VFSQFEKVFKHSKKIVYFLDCSRIFLTNLVTVKVFMTFITECSSILKKKCGISKKVHVLRTKIMQCIKNYLCIFLNGHVFIKRSTIFAKKKEHFYFRALFIKVMLLVQLLFTVITVQRALLFAMITVYRTYCSYGCCSSERTVHLGTRVAVGESPGHNGRAPWWLAA